MRLSLLRGFVNLCATLASLPPFSPLRPLGLGKFACARQKRRKFLWANLIMRPSPYVAKYDPPLPLHHIHGPRNAPSPAAPLSPSPRPSRDSKKARANGLLLAKKDVRRAMYTHIYGPERINTYCIMDGRMHFLIELLCRY